MGPRSGPSRHATTSKLLPLLAIWTTPKPHLMELWPKAAVPDPSPNPWDVNRFSPFRSTDQTGSDRDGGGEGIRGVMDNSSGPDRMGFVIVMASQLRDVFDTVVGSVPVPRRTGMQAMVRVSFRLKAYPAIITFYKTCFFKPGRRPKIISDSSLKK